MTATWTDLLPDPPRYPCANAPECPSLTARRAKDGLCGACNEQRQPDPAPTRDTAERARDIHDVTEGSL